MVMTYLAPVPIEGSLTRWTEDGHSSLVSFVENSHANGCGILVFRHYTTCPRDRTYGRLPSDSIFYQLVLCGCTHPLTGHSYLLHTLHDFVGTRGLTCVQGVLLHSTHSSDSLSSSVRSFMRRRPIHLPPVG